jgi:hypothetical protein
MRAELILERALLYAQCSMTARVKRIKIMKNEQINKFSILLKSDIGDADQYERGMQHFLGNAVFRMLRNKV